MADETHPQSNRSLSIWNYLKPARRGVTLTGILSLLGAQAEAVALVLLVPIAQGLAEDEENLQQSIGPVELNLTLTAASLLALGLILAAFVLTIVVARVRADLISRWERQERDRLMSSFMQADYSVQGGVKSGYVQGLSVYATRGGQALGAVILGIRGAASVAMFVALAFVVDWRAAVLVTLVGGCLFGLLRPLSRRVRQENRLMAQELLLYNQDVAETTALAREIRVFGAWPAFEDRLTLRSRGIEALKRRSQFLVQCLGPTYQYGGMLVIVAALLLAAGQSTIKVTELGAIAVLMLRSLNYANQLQTSWQVILDSTPFLEKLEDAKSRFQSVEPASGTVKTGPVQVIELQNLGYQYGMSTASEVALEHINLTLRRGEVVGIVGPSGAGKSTLVQALLRLRRPTSGSLSINGHPADLVDIDEWFSRVTFVPQSNVLFHGTIAENIGFLAPGIDNNRIVSAARLAHLHDVMEAMPEGYKTRVGPSSRDLSGGQVQRIGMARAFARQPDLLVLDEPTSALDVHSESAIHKVLDDARSNRITVVIAHRLSTLSVCDRIVVMESGRVVADGPMDEVARTNEFFRSALDIGTLDIRGQVRVPDAGPGEPSD